MADRDRAYAPEIALNGRTKALNNAAIISDGRIIDAREPFNIPSAWRKATGMRLRIARGNLRARVCERDTRARARAPRGKQR